MAFLNAVESQDFLNNLKNEKLFEKMLEIIIEAIKHDPKGENPLNLINYLNDLIDMNSEFLQPIFEKILFLINEIAKNEGFGDALRNASMHILSIYSEKEKVFFRKSEYFKKEIIPTLFKITSEIENDGSKWANQNNENNEDDEYDDQNPCYYAPTILRNLTENLGSKFMLKNSI